MDPVSAIALWATLFVASHLLISSQSIRPALVNRIGELPFRGLYSIVAFGTLIPLVMIFSRHKHAGAMLWYLRGFVAVRALTWLLMFAALIMLAASLISPSPSAIGAPTDRVANVSGMRKITRHPGHVAFSLFGIAHLLVNGWVGDVIFFATFRRSEYSADFIRIGASCAKSARAIAASSSRRRFSPARRSSADASIGVSRTSRGRQSESAWRSQSP
jgi:uncharacterized membrane protein